MEIVDKDGKREEKVENATSAEEAKKILAEAGLELTDTELDQVAGGFMGNPKNPDQETIV